MVTVPSCSLTRSSLRELEFVVEDESVHATLAETTLRDERCYTVGVVNAPKNGHGAVVSLNIGLIACVGAQDLLL